MEELRVTPWKIAVATAVAAPLLWAGALVGVHDSGPVCADRTGAQGYAAPGFAILGGEPRPACIRDDLPPLGN